MTSADATDINRSQMSRCTASHLSDLKKYPVAVSTNGMTNMDIVGSKPEIPAVGIDSPESVALPKTIPKCPARQAKNAGRTAVVEGVAVAVVPSARGTST
jgi:hypothetical protein